MDYDFTYTGAEIQAILDTGKKLKDSGYIFLGVATPSTNPGTPTQKVYYEAKQAGTYTNFGGVVLPDGISLLIWNGSWTSETVMCGDGGVFDISVYKSSGGTLATFADLAAALDGGNNIPASARKGGMSVKFVQSSDNKYVQYRLMKNEWSTDTNDWYNEFVAVTQNSENAKQIINVGEKGIEIGEVANYADYIFHHQQSGNGGVFSGFFNQRGKASAFNNYLRIGVEYSGLIKKAHLVYRAYEFNPNTMELYPFGDGITTSYYNDGDDRIYTINYNGEGLAQIGLQFNGQDCDVELISIQLEFVITEIDVLKGRVTSLETDVTSLNSLKVPNFAFTSNPTINNRIKELYLIGADNSKYYHFKYLRHFILGSYNCYQIYIYQCDDTSKTNDVIVAAVEDTTLTDGIIKVPQYQNSGIEAYILCDIEDVTETNAPANFINIEIVSNRLNSPSINAYLGNNVYYIGSDKPYKTLRAGIAAAIQQYGSIVYVDAEEFDLLDEFATEIAAQGTTQYGIRLANAVHVIFKEGSKVKALYDGTNANVKTYFAPFFADGKSHYGFTLENLDIEASNCRYCVHDELAGADIFVNNKYINCKMSMDDSAEYHYVGYYPQCIGGGCGKHTYVEIRNCYFKSKRAETENVGIVSYHNGDVAGAKNKIIVSNCYFADKGTYRCTYYGPSTLKSLSFLNNNSFGSNPTIGHEGGTSGPENFEVISFLNEIRS